MQLIHSHKDDVIIAGKPGVLLSRTAERALVKFDSGAVVWLASADVPLTAAERATAAAAPATVALLRAGGALVQAAS